MKKRRWVGLLLGIIYLGQAQLVPVSGHASEVTVQDLVGGEVAGTAASTEVPLDTMAGGMMISAAVSVPSSGGAPAPERAANYFQFDPYSGSGVMTLPLAVPQGRRGVQPSLALTYSPRGGNGDLGNGWSLGLGAIERSTKQGVPTYGSSDTFVASLGGGAMELVAVGGGEYQARVEGAFMKFFFDGQRWTARDKQGNTYYFGLDDVLADDSREADAGRVFRWYLSEVKDGLGNYYFARRFADGSFEILYTGEPGTDRHSLSAGTQNFAVRVVGEVESADRQDPVLSYRSGFLVRQRRRLSAVKVYAGGAADPPLRVWLSL